MAVERRATSGFWYARWWVNGQRVCRRLDARVAGVPGSAEFEASRAEAKAEEKRLRGAAAMREASFHRRMADALEGEARDQSRMAWRSLDEIGRHFENMKKGRVMSGGWRRTCMARLKAFAAAMKAKGAETLEQVSEGMAGDYMAALSAKGVAPATFNSTLDLLKGFYSGRQNPFDGIRRRPVRSESRVPFTRDELDRLVAACPDWMRGPVVAAACSGMRRGDACRLKWACVDIAGGFLRDVRVNKTGAVVDVPLLPMLRRELEQAEIGDRGQGTGDGKKETGGRRQKNKPKQGRYVWPEAARMAERNPNGLNWRMKKALSASGLPMMAGRNGSGMRQANLRGWHSLKTTFITEALNNGMPVPMLRKIVGNSTVDVVLRHYYQPDKARMAEEMRKALGAFGA